MRHNLEIPRPLDPLLARIEPAGEHDLLGKRPLFLGRRLIGRVVEHDIVDQQLGCRIGIELDIVNSLVLRERPAAAVGPAGFRQIDRRLRPLLLF